MVYSGYTPIELQQKEWPRNGLERIESCPVCSNLERQQLYSGLNDRVFFCAPGRWDVYRCKVCRSAYLDPRPTQDTIHLAYRIYYTHSSSNPRKLSRSRSIIRSLANGYRNRRFKGCLKPANPLGAFLMPLLPHCRRTLDSEMRYLPPLIPHGRLLDVGFGSAAFMMLAQRIGWRVEGVDIDPLAVAQARKEGLEVTLGGLEVLSDDREKFDVITMSHVIEHVHDPFMTIRRAFRLLKDGGLLYIETPNIDSYGHKRFREHWRGLEVPRHLVIFNWDSLTGILRENGFDDIAIIRKPNPYVHIARASIAIREGVDPSRAGKPNLLERLLALGLTCQTIFNWKRSEFITLQCRRSGGK